MLHNISVSQDFQESPDSLGLAQSTAAPCRGGGADYGLTLRDPEVLLTKGTGAHCAWAASQDIGRLLSAPL